MDWAAVGALFTPVSTPIITFTVGGVCGFLATRFTMSAAERKALDQRIYENSVAHRKQKEERYVAFKVALETCIQADAYTLDHFHSISGTGELYLSELKIISDAILGGKIDRHSRDNSFVPDIAEAVRKVIPGYYTTLGNIATKLDLPYRGEFRRANYESLFKVVEKYASAEVLPPADL